MIILPAAIWTEENVCPELEGSGYDLLDGIERPIDCDDDAQFDDNVLTAFAEIHDAGILFHLEQSCDPSGKLLPLQIRETKLQTAPLEDLRALEAFIRSTEEHVRSQVTLFAFWILRCERARRTGSPDLFPLV